MFATAQTDNAKTRAVSESVKKALDGGRSRARSPCCWADRGDVKGQGIAAAPGLGGEKLNVGDQSGLTLAELLPILSKALQHEIQSGQLSRPHDRARLHHQLYPGRAVSIRAKMKSRRILIPPSKPSPTP